MKRVLGIWAAIAAGCATGAASSSYADWGPYPPVAPFTRAHLPHRWAMVDMYFPVIGASHWKNDYDSPRGRYRHTGIDIVAGRMTPIVAPFSGTIGIKRESFWIYGDNGWAMLGTHLNDDNFGKHDHRGDRDVMFAPELKPGQHVDGGEFIGYVGDSGNATGPHLHFELYAPGNQPAASRIRNPWPSLKRAQHLKQARVTLPHPEQKPDEGQIRLQACVRTTLPAFGKAIFILVGKELSSGKVLAVSHPRYMRFQLSDQALADAGGWEALSHLPAHKSLALYLKDQGDLEGKVVEHIVVDTE